MLPCTNDPDRAQTTAGSSTAGAQSTTNPEVSTGPQLEDAGPQPEVTDTTPRFPAVVLILVVVQLNMAIVWMTMMKTYGTWRASRMERHMLDVHLAPLLQSTSLNYYKPNVSSW